MAHTPEQLSVRLNEALKRPNPVLFAGAGVGCRVGLPDWESYIEYLAAACERYDAADAAAIRQRAAHSRFLGAASIFKTCESIPTGVRYELLSEPFRRGFTDDELNLLEALVGLDFTAIVTTNYDVSLLSAASRLRRGWTRPVERGDVSMRGAASLSDFFVARIHGRAEQSQTMVVDTSDYNALAQDQHYLDFLLEVLRSRSCMFIGFSFLDPAIESILGLYEERFAPHFPTLHVALIPDGQPTLANKLHGVNIEALTYDSHNGHIQLWQTIRHSYDSVRTGGNGRKAAAKVPSVVPQAATVQKFMAFAYAQVMSKHEQESISELVQDGIVLSALPAEPPGVSEDSADEQLRQALRLSPHEVRSLTQQSVMRLVGRGQAVRTANALLHRTRSEEISLVDAHLNALAKGVSDRLFVREGVRTTAIEDAVVHDALEALFLWRAWDLAAHYAGAGGGLGTDLPRVIPRILESERRGRAVRARSGLAAAIADLLTAPEDREAEMLAHLGRAAFGLQVVMATPRQALIQKYALPQVIYLDANVLMPAITEGHPLRPVYVSALRQLRDTGKTHGAVIKMAVGSQFLDEIVSHRNNAIEMVSELGLEDPSRLSEHILFYGAANTNVFVGAYASWVGRGQERIAFADFLKEVAPYVNKAALRSYLERSGIATEEMQYRQHVAFTGLFNPLLTAYEADLNPHERLKDKVLIEHEAHQLTRLHLDLKAGIHSLFVTADARLRRILQSQGEFRHLAGCSMTHVGLVALVDVLVGIDADTRSLSRLMWTTAHSDVERALFDYFVRLALKKYDEGVAMEMQSVAQRVAAEAKAAAEAQNVRLFGQSVQDVAQTATFLDRFEDRFFENMRDAVERRERQGS